MQYQQARNAVPLLLARQIAKVVYEVFVGQISDKKLHNLIMEAIKFQGEALVRRTEIHESIVIDKDFKSLAKAINESNNIIINVQSKLIDVNKRIEELLCGNESE